MRWDRVAAFLTGCWILGSLFMLFVATRNFATADRISADPPHAAAQMFQTIGPENAHLLLRYMAGEQNRLFFVTWEFAQVAMGVALTAILLFALRNRLLAGLAGALWIVVLFERLRVTPEMIAIGRLMDFGVDAGPAVYNQFWRLHGLYGVLELVKLALATVVAILLFVKNKKGDENVPLVRDEYASELTTSQD